MTSQLLGLNLCNLIIPDDPEELHVSTSLGTWKLYRNPGFERQKQAIVREGKCANTYCIEFEIPCTRPSHSDCLEATLGELLALCLAASYLTCQAVAPTQPTMSSSVGFLTVGDRFPRQRSMISQDLVCSSSPESFRDGVQNFISSFANSESTEKTCLLVHHWLDALAFWSLEDLVLSTTTILEIISAANNAIAKSQNKSNSRSFLHGMTHAANRFNLPQMPTDFRYMRNDLVHEGTLSGTKFPGKNRQECAEAASRTLHWIDQYMHLALGIGVTPLQRFGANTLLSINSFSVDWT